MEEAYDSCIWDEDFDRFTWTYVQYSIFTQSETFRRWNGNYAEPQDIIGKNLVYSSEFQNCMWKNMATIKTIYLTWNELNLLMIIVFLMWIVSFSERELLQKVRENYNQIPRRSQLNNSFRLEVNRTQRPECQNAPKLASKSPTSLFQGFFQFCYSIMCFSLLFRTHYKTNGFCNVVYSITRCKQRVPTYLSPFMLF